MEMDKLSLISTNELLHELMNRYQHVIFCACKDRTEKTGEIMFDRKGLFFAQVGLAQYVCNQLKKKEPD